MNIDEAMLDLAETGLTCDLIRENMKLRNEVIVLKSRLEVLEKLLIENKAKEILENRRE